MPHKMKKKTSRGAKVKKAMSYGKKMAGYGKMPKSSKYSYKAKQ